MAGLSFMPKIYNVDVLVEFISPGQPPIFRFFQEDAETGVIEVDAYLAVIVLRLRVQGLVVTSPVSFASNLQWMDGRGLPLPVPPNLGVQRQSAECLVILDANPGATGSNTPSAYSFIVSVVINGQVYSSPDPTIVNKEPPIQGL